MSTSICSEKSGIVAFDSAIRRAIVACVRLSSTTVVSPFAVATPSSTAAWPVAASPVLAGAVGCRPSGAAGAVGAGVGAAVAVAVGRASSVADAGPDAVAAPSTSAFTMRPPGPEPDSVWRSTPRSSASLRASGEALIRS